MSKANRTVNTVSKIIAYLLVVLLILGIASGVLIFFLRNQGITYYVEYNDKKYYANSKGGNVWLSPTGETKTFSVKSLTRDNFDYNVQIIANSEKNFMFLHNDTPQRFCSSDEKQNDYSSVFDLKKEVDGFTITVPKNFTVKQAIEKKYGGNVEIQNELEVFQCYFIIQITSNKSEVNLWFDISPMAIELDTPQIVF